MSHTVNDDHLELALHLCDGQLLIQTLLFSREEDLGDVDVEEDMRESLEPSCIGKNLPIQNFSVYFSFTFHPHRFCPFFSYSTSCGGVDTLADSNFLSVQEVYLCKKGLTST